MIIQAIVSSIMTSSRMDEKLAIALPGSSSSRPASTPARSDSIGLRDQRAVTTATAAGTREIDVGSTIAVQPGLSWSVLSLHARRHQRQRPSGA